jgi:hypothetical protein
MKTSLMPPPGWYPDPSSVERNRYWDGHTWTQATQPGAGPAGARYGAPYAPRPSGPPALLPYHPSGLHLLGRWTQGLLIATGVWFAIGFVAALRAWSSLGDVGVGATSGGDPLTAAEAYAAASFFASLLMLLTGVVFIVWMFRYWGQVRILRSSERPRHGRGWTIGGWFVPFANLWIPKQIIDDYWRRTSSTKQGDEGEPVPSGFHWWWAAWLTSGLVLNVAAFTDVTEESGQLAFYLLSAAGDLISVAAAILATLMVGALVERLSSAAGYRP